MSIEKTRCVVDSMICRFHSGLEVWISLGAFAYSSKYIIGLFSMISGAATDIRRNSSLLMG